MAFRQFFKSELVVKVRMMKKEIHIFMKTQLYCIVWVPFVAYLKK